MPTVLSSRKLTTAQAGLLLNAGISYVEYEALEIEFLPVAMPSSVENAIFTSQNAVRQIQNSIPKLRDKIQSCFCVGEKTKTLLEANGFVVVETAENGRDLANLIVKNHAGKRFTFFCGNKRREELPKSLSDHNIPFEEITVYRTRLNPKQFHQEFDGVLFFSPSQVKSFIEKNPLKNQWAFCIGKTTATEAKKHTENTIIATKPTVENVIVQVVKHFNTIG